MTPTNERANKAITTRRGDAARMASWWARCALTIPPIAAVAALAVIAAGNTQWSSDPWRTARSAILWGTCVFILASRAWIVTTLERLSSASTGFRGSAPVGSMGGISAVLLAGMPLLLIVVAGEMIPAEGRVTRNARLLLLAPVCLLVLADWYRVRRELMRASLEAGPGQPGAHPETVVEDLLFRVTWIAGCTLTLLAITNALWSDKVRWQAMRPFLYSASLIYLVILWQSHGAAGKLLSQLPRAVRDRYRRKRAFTKRRAREVTLRSHFATRNWVRDDDRDRDRSASTRMIIEALKLRDGMRVAEVGCGGGYFALRMAEHVGRTGRVFATDVETELVARLGEIARRRRLVQLRALAVDRYEPLRGIASLDRVLAANVYLFNTAREAEGRAWLEQFAQALRPGGILVIYSDFVHEAGWVASPEWPPLAAAEADAQVLLRWAAPWFDLEADVATPPPARPLAAHERTGYLLALRRREGGDRPAG